MSGSTAPRPLSASRLRWLALWGPGLLVMLADCDAGNVVTAAQAGAEWGARLLPLLLALIPLLYVVQALTVRLGIFTGRGHGELVRAHFGAGWAWVSVAGLVVAVLGSLVTEFTGVAGVGEMFGVPRGVSLALAVLVLVLVALTGSHRRVDKVAMLIGGFELMFFAVAWKAAPDWHALAAQALRPPLGDPHFAYLAAALIGATFNPWMVFYQQAAVVDQRLGPDDYRAARVETALGAVLTQCLTGAVLVAAAATLAGAPHALQSVGEISVALEPVMGAAAARVLFGAGVLGASMVAAIVCSLALAWGLGEVAGYSRSLEARPARAPWFYGIYGAAVVGCAGIVWAVPDLVSLNVAAQVVNAVMLPLVIGLLVALAATALPPAQRLRGARLWSVAAIALAVSAAGVAGAVFGWLA
ncbi:divalent metal cation transporter [Burkholderia sp. FERM BP-3421]|uniref:NRAMP family divalent metal transporter n=1 Tax=Burkholderia sp. FERM BP-3421 TaxID=1494466 RepID=UPI00235F6E3E|nr:divalent metal cation transporter [Burkholderia sp. FERM BP-3421]WDD92385.1 divalent metal cation transporter [Burkholderia sp. FERM BP-3421]